MWATSSRYPIPQEMGMFVLAPPTSFHHHGQPEISGLISDPHSVAGATPSAAAATALGVGVGVGVFPLLTAAPCAGVSGGGIDDGDVMGSRSRSGGIQLWHNQQQVSQNPMNLMNFSGGSSGSGGAATCQDCGNQAKKDCTHRRCRTCCRSRGFDCATHVKSTWVPAARRRERQVIAAAAVAGGGGSGGGGASSGSTSGVKKPRLIASQNTTTTSHTSTSNTPPRSFDTSSSHQDASFKETLPGQVRAPAVFKCVRVTSVDDGEDEYAYQAAVKIGGHVFKGFLYDQGLEPRDGFPNLSDLHLGGSSSGGDGGGGGRNGVASSTPLLDPSDIYGGGSGGGLLGGSSYGNTIN